MSYVADADQDHSHLIDSVRSAIASERGSSAEPQHEPQFESEWLQREQEHVAEQHEANANAAQQVAQLLAQPEQTERKQNRDAKTGRFASAAATSVDQPAGPPTSWSAEARAEFARLSPKVQQAVLKRETEMQNGRQQWQDEQSRLRGLEEIMAPRRGLYERMGVRNDTEAVNYIFTLAETYDRDPVGFLAHSLSGTQMSRDQAIGMANMLYQRAGVVPRSLGHGPSPQALEQLKQSWIQESLPHVQQFVAEQVKQAVTAAQAQWHQRERAIRKTTATNASLTGAPHGVGNVSTLKRSRGGGDGNSFADIADDVRAAMGMLA
jgi:hypothetical protein